MFDLFEGWPWYAVIALIQLIIVIVELALEKLYKDGKDSKSTGLFSKLKSVISKTKKFISGKSGNRSESSRSEYGRHHTMSEPPRASSSGQSRRPTIGGN